MRQILAHVAAAIALGLPSVTARAQHVKPSNPARSAGDTQLVVVRLPDGISIGLPPGWHLEDAASNLERTRAGEAVLDLAQIPRGRGGLLLTATPTGDMDVASVMVSVQKGPSASQADVAALSGARLAHVQQQFREDLEAGMRIERARLVRWIGSEKIPLGALVSLVARYTYQMPGRPVMEMESHRIFLRGGSVGLMLQHRVDTGWRWNNMIDHVRDSFTASEW